MLSSTLLAQVAQGKKGSREAHEMVLRHERRLSTDALQGCICLLGNLRVHVGLIDRGRMKREPCDVNTVKLKSTGSSDGKTPSACT